MSSAEKLPLDALQKDKVLADLRANPEGLAAEAEIIFQNPALYTLVIDAAEQIARNSESSQADLRLGGYLVHMLVRRAGPKEFTNRLMHFGQTGVLQNFIFRELAKATIEPPVNPPSSAEIIYDALTTNIGDEVSVVGAVDEARSLLSVRDQHALNAGAAVMLSGLLTMTSAYEGIRT